MQKTSFLKLIRIIQGFSVILGIWYNITFFIPLLLQKEWISFLGTEIYLVSMVINIYILSAVLQIIWIVVFIGCFFNNYLYKKRKEILLFLIVCLILFAILEIGVRVLEPRQQKYSPHHYLNYYPTPNYRGPEGLNMHNSLGFRGPEITIPKSNGTYRVVTLGGSTTYSTGVKDWRNDFARKLQEHLRDLSNNTQIEVINAGSGGYGSWESLINLHTRVLEIEPDMIIIYHGINDVHPRLVHPDNYRMDNSGRRKQFEMRPLLFRFRIINKLTGIGPYTVDATTFAAHGKNTFSAVLNMTRKEALLKNEPKFFEANLKNMIAIARAHNITVLLATFAHSNEFDNVVTTEHYELGFKQNNDVVRKVAEQERVSVFDFASEMLNDKQYWTDGRHLNKEGLDIKGNLFAAHIFKNNLMFKETDEQE